MSQTPRLEASARINTRRKFEANSLTQTQTCIAFVKYIILLHSYINWKVLEIKHLNLSQTVVVRPVKISDV